LKRAIISLPREKIVSFVQIVWTSTSVLLSVCMGPGCVIVGMAEVCDCDDEEVRDSAD